MSEDAPTAADTAVPRPWLKPSAALNRYAIGLPRLGNDRDPSAGEHTAVRYGYTVGDIGLLVGERAGCEVISVPKIVRIPATPGWLLGVANLRGSLVPLFDLKSLFEIARPADEERFALIFDRGDQAVGILVTDYPKPLVGLEAVGQLPPLPATARDFVGAAWRHGRSVWLEFEHRRFFESLAHRMSSNS